LFPRLSCTAPHCSRRYQLRKINADRRPRIKGRFVKKGDIAGFLLAQAAAGSGADEDGLGGGGALEDDDLHVLMEGEDEGELM
jgi:hypothetical protein